MTTKDLKDRIDEVTAHERGQDSSLSITQPSISEPSSKTFGFGKKCLVVFAAALVASLILNQLPGASSYTPLDKAFGVDPNLQHTISAGISRLLGGAVGLFLMAMVIAAFVRGSAGALLGVILVGVWTYFSAYGALHDAKSTSATSAKHREETNSFRWQPVGSEYSIVFTNAPKISEVRGRGKGNDVTYLEATYSGKDIFEQAQFFPRPADLLVNKEVATSDLLNWASANGIQYADVRFNDSKPDDIVATLNGAKPVSTKASNIMIGYRGETHYGGRSIMITLVGTPAAKDMTPEAVAFLQSIRLER